MYYRCSHFNEGILPMCRKKTNRHFIKISAFIFVGLLSILPGTSSSGGYPYYQAIYGCEGAILNIRCGSGYFIYVLRAIYGRFSITICNDHGNTDWSVNCVAPNSREVLMDECDSKQNCSVLVHPRTFGHDPCGNTGKYLEVHYHCVELPETTTDPFALKPQYMFTKQPWWPTSSTTWKSESSTTEMATTTAVSTTTTTTTPAPSTETLGPVTEDDTINNQSNTTQSVELVNNSSSLYDGIDSNYYCGPTTARNLFWNVTRVKETNAQPCPAGATGYAIWRCVFVRKNHNQDENACNNNNNNNDINNNYSNDNNNINNNNNNNNNNINTNNINNNNINNNKDCDQNCDTNKKNNIQAVWYPETPDLSQCRSLWLNNLENRVNQRNSSLISIANDLSQVTSSKILYGGDMLVTTKIIQTMLDKMTNDIETYPNQRMRETIISELLYGVLKTCSNLLDVSQQLSWLDLSFEEQMRVAKFLLSGLESNAFLLAENIVRQNTVIHRMKNILLSIRVLETRNIVSTEIFPSSKQEQWPVSDDRIELPRSALLENSAGGLVRIVFYSFDRLEAILKPSYDNLDVKYSTNNNVQNCITNQTNAVPRIRVINSKVISASLGRGRHIQLSKPIRLFLRHLQTENVTNPTCVFWNYIDNAWSEDGCNIEETNKTHTICVCKHLTNFALLMDIVDENSSAILSTFDLNSRILIYVSIAICILFIIIAILTLKLFDGIFVKSTRTSIYKNIYVCLFIIEILFLLGIEQNETSLLCGFTTAFLHCFVLAAIAWLFFEGFQLYITLTTDDMLLEVENSSKIIWYYLLSYGLSFTIVAISLAVDPGTYTQGDLCVLMEANGLFYITFLIPIILFVLGTIGYPILAYHIMCKKSKTALKNKEHTRLTSVRFDLRCSFLFFIILSADWTFAYLYLRKTKMEEDIANIYGYLFITFNSLLGIYIFIFHCIQNEKIRREYRKYIRQNSWLPKCLRCSKTSSISSSSASHNQLQHYRTSSNKKSPIAVPVDPATENIVVGNGGAADGNGVGSGSGGASGSGVDADGSASSTAGGGGGGSIGGGTNTNTTTPTFQDPGAVVCPTIPRQHVSGTVTGSVHRLPNHRHNIMLERATSGTLQGHALPNSSSGSAHLIFNSMQNDQKPTNHEYFYRTEKSNKKKINGDIKPHKSDTAHTFYPSYRKGSIKHFAPSPTEHDRLSDRDFVEMENERKYFRYQQQKQMPMDDDHVEAQLIHPGIVGPPHPNDCYPMDKGSIPAPYRPMPPHSYMHMYASGELPPSMPPSRMIGGGPGIGYGGSVLDAYYNQAGYSGPEEPVYEEILHTRMSELCDHDDDRDDDRDDDTDDDDDDMDIIMEEKRYNQLHRMAVNKEDTFRQPYNRKLNEISYDLNQQKSYKISPTMAGMAGLSALGSGPSSLAEEAFLHRQQLASQQQYHHQQEQLLLQQQQQLQHHQLELQQSQPQQQQQIIGRNLSAMLDENNTVVCYLEPLPKRDRCDSQ